VVAKVLLCRYMVVASVVGVGKGFWHVARVLCTGPCINRNMWDFFPSFIIHVKSLERVISHSSSTNIEQNSFKIV